MLSVLSLVTLLLVVASSGFSMGKRDIFSPFDSKDTPSVFSKNDIKDALLVAQLKSKLAAAISNPPASLSNTVVSPSPPISLVHSKSLPKPNKYEDLELAGKSSVKEPLVDPHGSLYYYYYPTKSENRDTYVDAPSYLYDVDSAASGGGGVGGAGYGFFDMNADHTRYLIKIALPLFALGGVFLALSSFSSAVARSFDQSSDLFYIKENIARISSGYFPVSEECLDRVICEAGYICADYPITRKILGVMENLVPHRMRSRFDVFRSKALHAGAPNDCYLHGCSLSKRSLTKNS